MNFSVPDTRPALRRRGFLKIVALGGLAAGLGAAALRRWEATTARVSRVLMGTIVNLAVVSDDRGHAEAAVTAALEAMTRLMAFFDHRRPETALGKLNAEGALADPPAELVALLTYALDLSARTQGAFDVSVKPVLDAYSAGCFEVGALRDRVDFRQIEVSTQKIHLDRPGMALTLDGLAKGRVVDGAVAALRANGFERVFVEAGGDLLATGPGPDNAAWQVGIRDPRGADTDWVARISMTTGALATSGDYLNAFTADRSLHHIIDPRTLRSPLALAGATALANSAMEADALSTALLVLGPVEGLALARSLPGVEALLITKDGRRLTSPGFPTR